MSPLQFPSLHHTSVPHPKIRKHCGHLMPRGSSWDPLDISKWNWLKRWIWYWLQRFWHWTYWFTVTHTGTIKCQNVFCATSSSYILNVGSDWKTNSVWPEWNGTPISLKGHTCAETTTSCQKGCCEKACWAHLEIRLLALLLDHWPVPFSLILSQLTKQLLASLPQMQCSCDDISQNTKMTDSLANQRSFKIKDVDWITFDPNFCLS